MGRQARIRRERRLALPELTKREWAYYAFLTLLRRPFPGAKTRQAKKRLNRIRRFLVFSLIDYVAQAVRPHGAR